MRFELCVYLGTYSAFKMEKKIKTSLTEINRIYIRIRIRIAQNIFSFKDFEELKFDKIAKFPLNLHHIENKNNKVS